MPIARLALILIGAVAAAGVTVAVAALMVPSPVGLAAFPAALVASAVVGMLARRRAAQKDRP